MTGLIAHYGILIVVLIIYGGEIGLPTLIPGEIAILITASQVIHSVPQLIAVWLLFGIVDVLGCTSIHGACRTKGNRVLLRLLRFIQPDNNRQEEIIAGWRRRLGGRDKAVVFVTRLIPMFRLYASITTGLIRIRFQDFLCGAVPASLLWAATPLTLGYLMRARLHSMENQYPQILHYVIIGSVVAVAATALAAWVKTAGTKAAGFRRLRTALGLGAVGGTLARMALVAMYGDKPLSHWSLIPSLPSLSALSVWITGLSLVTLALLWIASRDLHIIRGRRHHHRKHSIGLMSTGVWAGLMMMFCALNTVGSVPHAAFAFA